MEYYAGLFDAEGCVSLTPLGSTKIRLNNTNEQIPNLFKTKFGGTVYKESKRKTKTIYSWYLNSENFLEFCNAIIPYSLVKKRQLQLLLQYKNSSRVIRRENRKKVVHSISAAKQPIQVERDYFGINASKKPDASFYKWLAGFIEGDGSIRIHENQVRKHLFAIHIGAMNVFPEPIKIIYQRLPGSLTKANSTPNPMWKWISTQSNAKTVLKEIMPYLIAKKRQAQLLLDFIKIKESKGHNDPYTFDQINQIRAIISEVKFHNTI